MAHALGVGYIYSFYFESNPLFTLFCAQLWASFFVSISVS